jgi:hypothetical protein
VHERARAPFVLAHGVMEPAIAIGPNDEIEIIPDDEIIDLDDDAPFSEGGDASGPAADE